MTTAAASPLEDMERHNGWLYLWIYALIFFASPVIYVGVIHAVLCDRLGASATIANLPAAAYSAGQFAPLVMSWLTPARRELGVVVWANGITAASLFCIAAALLLPVPDSFKIAAVVGQSLFQGLAVSLVDVFTLQCLGRGTTEAGRAGIFKRTFSWGPLFAVAGSMTAQVVLRQGIPGLRYPADFAAVYLVGATCMSGVTLLSARFRLLPAEEQPRQTLAVFVWQGVKEFVHSRELLAIWLVYLLWTCSRLIVPNLSLYAKIAAGREPQAIAGAIMAAQFAGKAVAGYMLGWLALRYGPRETVAAILAILLGGVIWAWGIHGTAYLVCFAFFGAALLGGTYIPNFVLILSPPRSALRNLSLLALATPAASFAPAIHGALADRIGFSGSFVFSIVTALAALALVRRLRERAPET